jgi:hypothetical protein
MIETTIEFHRIPQTVVVVRNFYTAEELQLVWKELSVICSPFLLQSEEHTGAAYDNKSETFLKKGSGLFLDRIYEGRRDVSHILSLGRKIFDKSFIDLLVKEDPNFKHLHTCDSDHTLVNYYEGGDEYKRHTDKCVFTANIVLWREPKKFDGGIFLMGENENAYDFKLNSNDMVIFPGYTLHAVTPIVMHEPHTQWYSGRYSIANFVSYR